jgi:hypothetical protein
MPTKVTIPPMLIPNAAATFAPVKTAIATKFLPTLLNATTGE